jgi:hypothetical protein
VNTWPTRKSRREAATAKRQELLDELLAGCVKHDEQVRTETRALELLAEDSALTSYAVASKKADLIASFARPRHSRHHGHAASDKRHQACGEPYDAYVQAVRACSEAFLAAVSADAFRLLVIEGRAQEAFPDHPHAVPALARVQDQLRAAHLERLRNGPQLALLSSRSTTGTWYDAVWRRSPNLVVGPAELVQHFTSSSDAALLPTGFTERDLEALIGLTTEGPSASLLDLVEAAVALR